MSSIKTCMCCGQQTDRATSSAPVVALLRILDLCWRERQTLPVDLVERMREQLMGSTGDCARADQRVLDAMAKVPKRILLRRARFEYGNDDCLAEVCGAELDRRGREAAK